MSRYIFHSTWRVDAPKKVVHDVLLDYERYPMWWRQVRSVQSTDDGMWTVCKSLLPYELSFNVVQYELDDGVLAAQLQGDLEGITQWSLHDAGSGTRIEYHQEVTLEKRLLRPLSPVLRPAFRLNHFLMMRDGRMGLKMYLAGFQARS